MAYLSQPKNCAEQSMMIQLSVLHIIWDFPRRVDMTLHFRIVSTNESGCKEDFAQIPTLLPMCS